MVRKFSSAAAILNDKANASERLYLSGMMGFNVWQSAAARFVLNNQNNQQ
ncbi:hypothetical protein [Treponema endosymbiont of Eucomonympha sp.]|nr:hypothetical protein [Treponema endosymbiont of Eucomonympha sp.]